LRIVFDIECNALHNPTEIWLIACYDIDTKKYHVFRNVTKDQEARDAFLAFVPKVTLWIGHNILGYDCVHLNRLLGVSFDPSVDSVVDTFVVALMADFGRKAHSIQSYGEEIGKEKITFTDFSKYSKELEEYCLRDIDIGYYVYTKYLKYIEKKENNLGITIEQRFKYAIVNLLEYNGFNFDVTKATKLLDKVTKELSTLDAGILKEFPSKLKLIREITPKATKHGTISLTSIPKSLRNNIHEYTIDAPFCYCSWTDFNPASHKQVIDVLNEAGWKPEDKTDTHKDTERELAKLKRDKQKGNTSVDVAIQECYTRLSKLEKYGWKINEHNLSTLPEKSPPSARLLAKRILYEARRRTLTEWLGLVREDGRIHGEFEGIGTWTQRMATTKPNTQNIPNEFDTQGNKKLLGKELRSLWRAAPSRLLVGVDAEGIQLRIFAHYIDDPEFTQSLVDGKKEDKSDPHSLNQSILGPVCKSRAAAKRYIYALLLGAGQAKLREILDCSDGEAREAYERLLSRYTGFQYLKDTIIPKDARRGWFYGLDGRQVAIPGDTDGARKHLAMSGYLQNGEATVMKHAALHWQQELDEIGVDYLPVNMVHDEWQTECPNDFAIAKMIAETQANSLKIVGEKLGLKCPLAGSYWNDDLKDYTIGMNWSVTH
jgi:DNA polymerase-1